MIFTLMSSRTFTASTRYLENDRHLGAFIRKHGPITHRRKHSSDVFQELAEAIIYQQLSGKAADTICKRFVALFRGNPTSLKLRRAGTFPTPKDVLKMKEQRLRSAGLSRQKIGYLKDLAKRCTDGTIEPKKFSKMTDEEIIEHVTAVKGIGEWTAHIFLMFTLGRPDVLPTGDLGIQKGFQKLFKLRTRPTPERMLRLAKGWSGHRTTASFYLWRFIDST